MSIEKIIGQNLAKKIARQSIKNEQVSHAYVIEGPVGIGKKEFALNFAKGITCKDIKDDACDKCRDCIRIEHGNHPDIYWIKPDGKSIKNDQIEEIQRHMNRKTFEADKNIFILESAETMTVQAQNRFLKMLEEPTGDSVIIFLTSNEHILLPTIISRCTKIKLNNLPQSEIMQYMEDKYQLTSSNARLIANFSYGIIGRAEMLHGSEDFTVIKDKAKDIFILLLSNDENDFLEVLDAFDSIKDEIHTVLEMLNFFFRDLAVLDATENNNIIINNDNIKTIEKYSDIIGYAKALKYIEYIEEAKKDFNSNINYNLTIKNLFLKIQEERHGKSRRSSI